MYKTHTQMDQRPQHKANHIEPYRRDQRMDKEMWSIYTMGYYTAEKNNGILKFAGKWMNLKSIILTETIQT